MKKGGAAFPAAPYSFKDRKVFDALEWLAAMCSHVPNWGEQMVRYYGWYSNVLQEKRLREPWIIPFPAPSNLRGLRRHYRKDRPG